MIIFSIQSPELVRAVKIREEPAILVWLRHVTNWVSWLLSRVGGLCREHDVVGVRKIAPSSRLFSHNAVSIGNKDQRPNQKDCV